MVDSTVAECLHDKRETLGSSTGRTTFFLFGGSVWVRELRAAAKGQSRRFRYGSEQIWGRILLSGGEVGDLTGRSCGSVAQC